VSFYKLLDATGIDGKDVLYSIDFEVSEKPIEKSTPNKELKATDKSAP
jgi:hypothetical protein